MAIRFPPPPCPPPRYPPPSPPSKQRVQPSTEKSLLRDFCLSTLTASPNALINPYDIELHAINFENIIDAHTDPESVVDTDDEGWLASHKQAHQRAIAQYAMTAITTVPLSQRHFRTNVDPMHITKGIETSEESPAVPGPGGIINGATTKNHPPKATLLKRCGRALYRKRSFWLKESQES
ncbi:hypothetical protein F5B22DRAFT_644438 [Xylaria bambusicola]|uniref:uncharacterized protein n=1 Tax=Xylaria bambusicola TaxID=326684 RepID=UPI0020076232|nr:uncharacterized protein F5B22DRAFT_644438 [Xylaria bambusicola]KAI0520689.1 hypothetical protein F5B22DRAFT_644438 [Xylaria bambusicola]